jgi:peptidoglycan/LPS O-acetylase OafA/YrhL
LATSPENRKRIDGVDLLRGLAIFFVLMNHVTVRLRIAKVPFTDGMARQLVTALFFNGQRGVQIFFAVSGFLITTTSLRRWGNLSNIRIGEFYRLRFARIAPLLLLLLAILSFLHVGGFKDYVIRPDRGTIGGALLSALTFRINVYEANHGYLPGSWDILWSLSIEEMFYLFFPLLCRWFGRGKLLIGILAIFVVLGPFGRTVFAKGLWEEYSYLGGMDAIALGCLTALLVANKRIPQIRLAGFAGAALLVSTLCFSKRLVDWGLEGLGLNMTLVAVGTCLVIATAAQTNWRSPGFLHPLLAIGERSYEIYLTHMFVVFAFFNLFVAAGKPMVWVAPLFIATIVSAALLGDLVARLYSDPSNQWLRCES